MGQPNSSGDPLAYVANPALDPTLLDCSVLCAQLENGQEFINTWVHQNLMVHHISQGLQEQAMVLQELAQMVGEPFCP